MAAGKEIFKFSNFLPPPFCLRNRSEVRSTLIDNPALGGNLLIGGEPTDRLRPPFLSQKIFELCSMLVDKLPSIPLCFLSHAARSPPPPALPPFPTTKGSSSSPSPTPSPGSDQLMEMTRLAIWKMCNQQQQQSNGAGSNGSAKGLADLHR